MNREMSIEDEFVNNALEFFIQAMGNDQWKMRKSIVVNHMSQAFHTTDAKPRSLTDPQSRISFDDDKMAWYLLLAESYLNGSELYDHAQGARVIPVFLKIGGNIDGISSINGVEERVASITRQTNENPDIGLFELLVALAYIDSGCGEVCFLPECPERKTPDLAISLGESEFVVECKRMSCSSAYSRQEREKWLRMWEPVAEFLQRNRCPFLLSFVFHMDLESLDDTFLKDELIPLLRLVVTPGTVVSNDTWTVTVGEIDPSPLEDELRKRDIKVNSAVLMRLLGGPCDPNWGFTWTIMGRGSGQFASYLSEVKFAAGARWKCDAPSVIERKARDIKKHVANATHQIPADKTGIVHVGLESLDGDLVGEKRYSRIKASLFRFTMEGTGVVTVYCHVFRPLLHPKKVWDFEEKTHSFTRSEPPFRPLKHELLIVPEDSPPDSSTP